MWLNRHLYKRVASAFLSGLMLFSAGHIAVYADETDKTESCEEVISGEYVEGEAIVAFRSDKNHELSEKEQDTFGNKIEREIGMVDDASAILDVSGNIITHVKSDTLSTSELIERLEEREDVIYAEPNYISTTDSVTPDYTSNQYNAEGTYSIGVDKWNTYSSGIPTPDINTTGYVVAVCDSGIDYENEDLKNVMWDEGLNYPELVTFGGGKYGYNACHNKGDGDLYDTTDPYDDGWGHGTHVSGIIAAEWNGIGVSGMTCGAKLMAVKIFNNVGENTLEETIRGYEYIIAARKAGVNVRVINNSWHDNVFGHTMDILIREAGELGIVSVCAAGNREEDLDNKDIMQRNIYDNPYVIIVGASDKEGEATSFSNYGKRSVDVFAPGDMIFSTAIPEKGIIDINDEPYQNAGKTYLADYTDAATSVTDNRDNTVFGFHSLSGEKKCNLSKVNLPGVGEVLKVEPEEAGGTVCIESDEIGDISDSLAIVAEIYTEKEGVYGLYCCTSTYYDDEEDDGIASGEVKNVNGVGRIMSTYPKLLDKENAKLALEFSYDYFENPEYVYIKKILVVSHTSPYQYSSGTSQATPAVAGEVINVLAAFPNDSTDKIVARVKGSVLERDGLKDKCISGGIARQDKAILGDTKPVINSVSQNGNVIEIGGFFFGDAKGSVRIDGAEYPSDNWTDTLVSVSLPSDLKADEHKFEIESTAGKSGYRYERTGVPKSLYDRLPLPGRSLEGTPGKYSVTSNEFDDTFYNNEIKSLVGLDGSLYAIISTKNMKTAIYKYDIDLKSWEMLYHGGYAASEGACTWKGKLLFLASDIYGNKGYTAVFDPETNDVAYTLADSENHFSGRSIVNSGKGVFAYGGCLKKHGVSGEQSLIYIQKLDESSMTFKDIKNTGYIDARSVPESAPLVYDKDGNFYSVGGLIGGIETDRIIKVIPSDDEVEIELISEGKPLIDNRGEATGLKVSAAPIESGIILSGCVAVDGNKKIVADTFTGSYGAAHFEPTDKLVSMSSVYSITCTAYRDKYYALGPTNYETGKHVFAATDVKTIPQPGDVVRINSFSGEGGSLDREGIIRSYVGAGESFKITPEGGYKVSSIKIDGVELSADEIRKIAEAGYYAFEDIKEDHKIEVYFEKEKTPDVTPPSDPDSTPAPAPGPEPGEAPGVSPAPTAGNTPANSSEKANINKPVNTGDNTNLDILYALMIISAIGMGGVMLPICKRSHKRKNSFK